MSLDAKITTSRPHRFPIELAAELHYRGRAYSCGAHNLSRTGVLLVGQIPWPAEDEVDITLKSPTGDLELVLRGHPARIGEDDQDRGTQLALEFMDITEAQRGALEILLSRVIEGHTPGPLEGLRPGAPPQEVRKAIEAVPLTHRITLAGRATTPRERDLFRQDPHPLVLESLARNPSLIQAEACALASVPHLLPSTLEILAHDPRWTRDEEIRVLLSSHPRIALPLAERLVADLKPPVLKRIMRRSGVNPILREKLQKKLTRG